MSLLLADIKRAKEDTIRGDCADAVMFFEMGMLCRTVFHPILPHTKRPFLNLMQHTQLKGEAGNLTRMENDSNMVIVFLSLLHWSSLVEGKADI